MAKAYPNPRILIALQSQPLSWWKRLAELVDNSIDAGARNISVSFRDRVLEVIDDGCGIRDPQVLVTLGLHEQHGASVGLGRYGVGAKDAWLCTGYEIFVDTIHESVRRTLSVDVREMIQSNWDIPDTTAEPTSLASGTTIRIPLSPEQSTPSWPGLSVRLGWVFSPAIKDGLRFIHSDSGTLVSAAEVPPLLHAVRDSFVVDGKSVSIDIGMLPEGAKSEFTQGGPFWIQHRHRTIDSSGIGTKGRCVRRIAGVIVLGDEWTLSKNKDELCGDTDSLAQAIFERIAGLLDECEETAEQIETDALKIDLEERLNAALNTTKREKRSGGGDSRGTAKPAYTGRRRTHAADTSDNPGSVLDDKPQRTRRGFSLGFTSQEDDILGRFDSLGKTIYLNQDHVAIAKWKEADNRDAILFAAAVILSQHDATLIDGQKIMGFAAGDFIGPCVKLITSLVATEGVANAV